jgi:nicotinamide-nucleotide amidase
MNAEIISIGTELLMGEITDTNARFLAGELPGLGINLYWVSQVGDNQARLVKTLKRAWQRSDLILTSGGLGPTADDITREAIAETLGEEMKVDATLEREVRELFRSMNRDMPETNLKQAMLIPSARPLRNVSGTAPGWWVERDGHILVAMPGPPREIHPMWRNEVLPRLREKVSGETIVSRTIKLFGISEAKVAEMVARQMAAANPTLGVYAKTDGIQLRIGAKAPGRQEAEALISPVEAGIRALFGEHVWGFDEDTLEVVAGRLLKVSKKTLAVMEHYSGGLLSATITSSPDAAGCFKGGLVAPSDEVRIAYGIDFKLLNEGRESPAVAQAMAEAVRVRLGANIGLGITGTDEPGKMPGSLLGNYHIGVSDDVIRRVVTQSYPGDRNSVRQWTVSSALFELVKLLRRG